jgi:hypothetical protein
MTRKNVMIDIETLGNGNFAAILSIGACRFDPRGDTIESSFYALVDPESCQKAGLRIDAATVMWWMDPRRDAARTQLMQSGVERLALQDALSGFAEWYGQEGLPTWGNGSDFDNVIVSNAFKLVGLDCPWKFWDNRCFRTVKNIFQGTSAPPFEGEKHNALADAIHQAQYLQTIAKAHGLPL